MRCDAISRETDVLASIGEDDACRLEELIALLSKWQRVKNLVAPNTLSEAWRRHVLDSAQLLSFVPPDARTLLDIGSGGGFPGLVLALLLESKGVNVTLVEPNGRKVAFLRAAAREVSIPVTVRQERVEEVAPDRPIDIITARAVAPLDTLCAMMRPLWSERTLAILPKGENWRDEVEKARESWSFRLASRPSATDPDAAILLLKGLAPGPSSRL